MNQQTKDLNNDRERSGQQENAGNENASSNFASPEREANPLFSDSIPVSDERNLSEDEKDERIKNEPDTARLRSERQSVIDNQNENE